MKDITSLAKTHNKISHIKEAHCWIQGNERRNELKAKFYSNGFGKSSFVGGGEWYFLWEEEFSLQM